MKLLNCMVICIAAMIILSCTKKEVKTYEQSIINGIKITESSTTPADSTFKVVLKEVCFINNDTLTDPEKCIRNPSSMDLDDKGNLFVLDRTKYKVFKYDTTGKLVKTFGGQGMGPGELVQPGTVNARKDTIYITDFQGFKIHKFDLDGNYISSKQYEDFDIFPQTLGKFGENYLSYGSIKVKQDSETGKSVRYQEVGFYDKNINFIKNLCKIEYDSPAEGIEFDPSEKGLVGAASSSEAYVYEFSKTQYKIDVYNISGDKIREIRKKYARIKTPEDLQKQIIEMWAKRGMKIRQEFMNSITNLYADKYKRLWVITATTKEEDIGYYDIFENDIFINRIKLDTEKDYSPRFVGDKIVGFNYSNGNIKIYEY